MGDWIVSDEKGQTAILVVKDIVRFRDAMAMAKFEDDPETYQQRINEIIDLVEFADVKVSKKGKVKWRGGCFVGRDFTAAGEIAK